MFVRGRVFSAMCAIVVLFCFMILPGAAAAQEKPTLHLIGDADYAPYSFLYGGTNKGIDVEVVEELAVRLGISIRVELVSYEQMLAMTAAGQCDGVLNLRPTKENTARALLLRSHPLHVSTYSVFTRRAARFKVDSLEDLKGRSVGLMEGVNLGSSFKRAVKEGAITATTYPDRSQALGALLRGQIDAFIGQTKSTYHVLGQMGMSNTIQAEGKPLFKRGGEYLGLLKGSDYPEKEVLLKLMELALEDLFSDGTYRRIVHRYVL